MIKGVPRTVGSRRGPDAPTALFWRKADPAPAYDVIVVGGGAHGLATAFSLAHTHKISRVAVLERGLIGGGNAGRNTTIVRSNYWLPETIRFYEYSLKLWETLSQTLDFNVMFSPRGVVFLAHDRADEDALIARGNRMLAEGVDAEWLDPAALRRLAPALDPVPGALLPVRGGLMQRRAGTARHDAVVWGYARAASRLGVDVIEHCPVTGFVRGAGGQVEGVETPRGVIRAPVVGLCTTGQTGTLLAREGIRLPLACHVLQAFVTEPVKPVLSPVVISNAAHVYVSQTEKGELVAGGSLDAAPGWQQAGPPERLAEVAAGLGALFPRFRGLRIMRSWAGVVDMTMDGSPLIGPTPVPGLYINAGWNYGGFKATPASGQLFATLLATGTAPPLIAPFALERFERGALLDEGGAGPRPWLQ
ncbi:sarcosine oxidase subunit beta family protein [Pararhodospirillum photometricum]|uniref:Glycine oxidase ThiO n=1 Tax=Pararhodospirillum photometricum DSM 122 TaxID=1150469 RepID=H6SQ44_PARPM|nr:sarcosine oxidase subunit beta family protein [Pararhodospirillum photometricum]CCG09563.1 Glycine oxidase ThiO [Pararhodospirillum photometricum DSM 122]